MIALLDRAAAACACLHGRHVVLLLMLAASLGLPWAYTSRIETGLVRIPGYVVPSTCRSAMDNNGMLSMECTPGYVAPDMFNPTPHTINGVVHGHQHEGRFGVACALLLLVAGARRRSLRLERAAGLVLIASTTLTAGLGFHAAGVALASFAAVLLVLPSTRSVWRGEPARDIAKRRDAQRVVSAAAPREQDRWGQP